MSENTDKNALQASCLQRITQATQGLFQRLTDNAADIAADDMKVVKFGWHKNRTLQAFLIGTSIGALSAAGFLSFASAKVADDVTTRLIEERVAEEQTLTPIAELEIPLTTASSDSSSEITEESTEAEPLAPDTIEKFNIKRNESLANVLRRAGLTNQESYKITTALSDVLNLKQLQIGDLVEVGSSVESSGSKLLLSVTVEDRHGNRYTAARADSDYFEASMVEPEVSIKAEIAEGMIDGPFVLNAKKNGIPTNVVQQIIWAFDGPIDFSRDLRKGDSFTAVFNKEYNKDGEPTGNGELVYASFKLRNSVKERYRYVDTKGQEDFYDEKGKIARKLFTLHPLRNPRMTSRFGQRRHPILGYKTMHWGADYGAPIGTPIRSPGEGVIVQAGRRGSYGRYVRIKHNSEYQTAYAHMSKIKDSIYVGKRVKAGEIIGAVGNSGRSTGPHLHWELMKNGKKINPVTQKITAQRKLSGEELNRFYAQRNKIRDRLTDETAYAKAEALPEARKMSYQEQPKPKKTVHQRVKTQKTASRRVSAPRG